MKKEELPTRSLIGISSSAEPRRIGTGQKRFNIICRCSGCESDKNRETFKITESLVNCQRI